MKSRYNENELKENKKFKSGSSRICLDLEQEAASALPVSCQLLEFLHLLFSQGESQALLFAKIRLLHNKNYVIHANKISVNHVPYLKLLGITIGKHQIYI